MADSPAFTFRAAGRRTAPSLRRLAVALLMLMLVGCDQVPGQEEAAPPRVSDLQVTPDSVRAAALPPEQVQDSVAQVPLRIAARAADPDGAVERVVFTFEPATTPRNTGFGTLQATTGDRYARDVVVGLPTGRNEVYTIRVYAVDADSLASDQVVGQLRFVAPPGSTSS